MTTEFWLQCPPVAEAETIAMVAEESGWDGVQFADGRSGDVFVALARAAGATKTVKLATGVVNPVVRHPAVLASAIASVGRLAEPGRMSLGIGRGDSSLHAVHLRPPGVAAFTEMLIELSVYLRGGSVGGAKGSHVPWLAAQGGCDVEVDVAATGPRVIEIGAELGDRVTLAVGAQPSAISWGLERARRGSQEVPVGAVVAMGVDDTTRDGVVKARGPLSVTVNFAAGALDRAGVMAGEDVAAAERVSQVYDYDQHARSGSPQAEVLGEATVRRLAVVGSPEACVERLNELAELGLSRIVVMLGTGAPSSDDFVAEIRRVGDAVLGHPGIKR
ncbi:LLM class flavin-dependent oxidoreductase [Aeromicrobium sp. YIM 150415]|uniref:LLM class flavin-dependent oxidoreductase n=1 Tax=Aeromicrobium sp. YIM 150415 TaxID=2803912 RepID=UPI001964FBEF|nr:LLM class flavin-dependent oxidoreductase [Aeromicrobium sp. YIM 150415]MBM9463601.1 LLM class flavin-dependent oxidoreductase [Aeromicrobium sp. YIM 150415]